MAQPKASASQITCASQQSMLALTMKVGNHVEDFVDRANAAMQGVCSSLVCQRNADRKKDTMD
eukprot:scaffold9153_cov121-Cylindrotheca_fusiformis.AAC.7